MPTEMSTASRPQLAQILICSLALLVLHVVLAQTAKAATFTLYDGPAGGSPGSQPWLTYAEFGDALEAVNSGTTTLDSTAADSAGYNNYGFNLALKNANFPTLDRTSGFRFSFTVSVNSESHTGTNGTNRAGFSAIALGSDKQGIELGFWTDRVWAQEGGSQNLFTKAESSLTNTTNLRTYNLTIVGNSYLLSSGTTSILSGNVRSYTAFSGFPDVYEFPNFVFLGDNTSSAHANVTLTNVSISTLVRADMNGDAQLDFEDVLAFEDAVSDTQAYLRKYGLGDWKLRGDLDGDGDVDNFDVEPLRLALGIVVDPPVAEALVAVPEPAARTLLALGALAGLLWKRRRVSVLST